MKRAIVIGCPGAGKSTFARKLKDKTGLPLYYLDRIFHKPDRTTVPREEFDQKLQTILQTDRWIIDGNYQRTCLGSSRNLIRRFVSISWISQRISFPESMN